MLRRYLATAATVAVTAGTLLATGPAASAATAAVAASGHPAPAAVCASTVVIAVNSFDFSPTQVTPGQSSTANLVTTNCTATTQKTQQTWTGQYVSATGTALPSGCPAIDPLPRTVTYTANQELLNSTSYLILAGCTANALKVTVKITSSTGALLNQATATLLIQQ